MKNDNHDLDPTYVITPPKLFRVRHCQRNPINSVIRSRFSPTPSDRIRSCVLRTNPKTSTLPFVDPLPRYRKVSPQQLYKRPKNLKPLYVAAHTSSSPSRPGLCCGERMPTRCLSCNLAANNTALDGQFSGRRLVRPQREEERARGNPKAARARERVKRKLRPSSSEACTAISLITHRCYCN